MSFGMECGRHPHLPQALVTFNVYCFKMPKIVVLEQNAANNVVFKKNAMHVAYNDNEVIMKIMKYD
jgi:hypothetical protein